MNLKTDRMSYNFCATKSSWRVSFILALTHEILLHLSYLADSFLFTLSLILFSQQNSQIELLVCKINLTSCISVTIYNFHYARTVLINFNSTVASKHYDQQSHVNEYYSWISSIKVAHCLLSIMNSSLIFLDFVLHV